MNAPDSLERDREAIMKTTAELLVAVNAADTALERVTYTVGIRAGADAPPIEDAAKGLHVYARQADGSWKLTCDIWNSDRSGQVQ